ncbi:hypothetical protein A2617_00640 [Candidatus Daviesbacteria bacterium RIFOXYD1_FULL_41_10]|uniref:General secretion pathway GspH domain-containing protein n=1 Tax=Candidatus Daviesbacteria bacterium RIFOXYD1_FULL_41_10 TaxID=1797801 RepID=A0A1F5N2N7_9BACT|nr:MAG: hypothetical protein A2617_00640 [Candidatus Daviesbacteria bacterium RIFOXYD1_FULL_41_10]
MRGKGFTLIELLVVVGIIIAMMGVLIPQIDSFQKRQALKNAAEELSANLKTAQNRALSGVKCNLNSSALSWSIKFIDETSYQLETDCNDEAVSGTPYPVLTYSFPDSIAVKEFAVWDTLGYEAPACANDNELKVSFSNISGKIAFDERSGTCGLDSAGKVSIVLSQDDSSAAEVRVTIERGGLVKIDQ